MLRYSRDDRNRNNAVIAVTKEERTMSTRGAIGRDLGKGHFEAVYHHWDSYTTALGKTLFNLRNGHFKGDTEKMLSLLMSHTAGWSTINDADFNKEPGYDNKGAPQCYCHGSRSETGHLFNETNASGCGVEYVYLFSKNGKTMKVLSSYCDDNPKVKMVGMFGCGDPKAKWKVIAKVDLDGSEPDWNKIEG